MQYLITEATENDVDAIYDLINELAVYELAPLEVTVSKAQLLADGFGENPVYKAFVAKIDAKTVGFALYYEKYSTWKGKCIYLEDLYIKPEYRKYKIGETLFLKVKEVAAKGQYGRMEWQVLFWNSPALSFYRKHKANLDNDWVNGKFTRKDLDEFLKK